MSMSIALTFVAKSREMETFFPMQRIQTSNRNLNWEVGSLREST